MCTVYTWRTDEKHGLRIHQRITDSWIRLSLVKSESGKIERLKWAVTISDGKFLTAVKEIRSFLHTYLEREGN